jgi:hypothetical protein
VGWVDGQENILFINVVSCPEGLKNLAEKTPGDPLSLSLSLSLSLPPLLLHTNRNWNGGYCPELVWVKTAAQSIFD